MSVYESPDIPSHVFRFVERELYDYPVNKLTCADYERERDDVLQRTRQQPETPGMPPSTLPSDEVAVKAAHLLLIEQRVQRVAQYVRAIDSVMTTLCDDGRTLVKRKYFDADTTNEVLIRELCIDRKRFYALRRDVVRKFAMRFGLI